MTLKTGVIAAAVLLAFMLAGILTARAWAADTITPASDADVLAFTMTDIDGNEKDLGDYRGSVVLMVNVASKCGLTPQYDALEALYRAHKDEGLVVLGFPANNFMGQEPGTDLQIKQFCTGEYDVTFPMFSKISVKGEDKHPLYQKLTGQPEPIGGAVSWNFQKYLVDRDGNVVAMFGPRTKPDDEKLTARVRELLATG